MGIPSSLIYDIFATVFTLCAGFYCYTWVFSARACCCWFYSFWSFVGVCKGACALEMWVTLFLSGVSSGCWDCVQTNDARIATCVDVREMRKCSNTEFLVVNFC